MGIDVAASGQALTDSARGGAARAGLVLPAWATPHRLLIAAGVLLPALLFVATAWQSRLDIAAEFEQRATRSAATVQEHARKVLEFQDLFMDRTLSLVRAVGPDRLRERQTYLHDELAEMVRDQSQLVGIAIWDAEGAPYAISSMPTPPPGMSIAGREYFVAHRDADIGLYISDLLRAPVSGADLVVLSRRLPARDGAFAGVVVVSLRADYFARYYAEVTRGNPYDAITLLTENGAVLARHPPPLPGAVLGPGSAFQSARQVRPERGYVRAVSAFDGTARGFAYNKVVGYPLYVSYSIAVAGERAEWLANLRPYALFTVLAIAGFAAAGLLSVRQERRAAEAEASRLAEAESRRRLERELAQARRIEVLGLLTGGVAHDFNNCLAIVVGNVERAQKLTGAESPAARPLKLALVGATRAGQLTRRLTNFARRQPLQPQDIDPGEVVNEVAALARSTFPSNIAIRVEVAAETAAVFVDPSEFENAVLNLLINARDAMPSDGGEVRARASDGADWPGEPPAGIDAAASVVIEIADTGAGMSEAVLARAFEPFFTTKGDGGGSGLGLAQVYGFVRQSGGHVTVTSQEGKGTSVVLWLPRFGGVAPTGSDLTA